MIGPMVWATVLGAVACVALVVAERRRYLALRSIAKHVAALAFVAVGALAIAGNVASTVDLWEFDGPRGWFAFQFWILAGLGLGLVGDIAMLGETNRAFLVGLAAFLLGHLAYLVGIAQLVPPRVWLGEAGVFAVAPIVVGVGALVLLWRRLGTMRVPVTGYVIAIVTMMIAAIAAARTAGDARGTSWDALPVRNGRLLVVGAALFFVSDLAVARNRFVGKRFANQLWGLPAYFAGQLVIAWSLAL